MTIKVMPFLKVSSIWYLVSGIRNTKYLPCRQAGKILNTKYCKAKGFTLIELLVVMTIIAILIAAVSASFTNAQIKGRDGKRKADLKAVQQGLELYLQTNGAYPLSSDPHGQIFCMMRIGPPGPTVGKSVGWGAKFDCPKIENGKPGPLIIIYLQQLPKDPTGEIPYYYEPNSSYLSYVLSAKLENTNDPENINSPNYVPGTLPCVPQSGRNYCVVSPSN